MIAEPMIIDSGRPGPTLLVLGGVHGDERCGVELVSSMMRRPQDFMPSNGKIVCAFGNPAAIKMNVRCVTHNLNRLFLPAEESSACSCSEHERVAALRTLFASADVLLDIHASFTPQSEPFVICERNALELIRGIPPKRVCFGFDAIQPGGTDYYMNAIGKVGICVECGYLGDTPNNVAERSLAAVMNNMGMWNFSDARVEAPAYLQAYQQYFTRENFRLAIPFADFDELNPESLIGYDGSKPVYAKERSKILFAHNCAGSGAEAFVLLREL